MTGRIDTSNFDDVAAELVALRHRARSLDAGGPNATAEVVELVDRLIEAVKDLTWLAAEKIGEAARRE